MAKVREISYLTEGATRGTKQNGRYASTCKLQTTKPSKTARVSAGVSRQGTHDGHGRPSATVINDMASRGQGISGGTPRYLTRPEVWCLSVCLSVCLPACPSSPSTIAPSLKPPPCCPLPLGLPDPCKCLFARAWQGPIAGLFSSAFLLRGLPPACLYRTRGRAWIESVFQGGAFDYLGLTCLLSFPKRTASEWIVALLTICPG